MQEKKGGGGGAGRKGRDPCFLVSGGAGPSPKEQDPCYQGRRYQCPWYFDEHRDRRKMKKISLIIKRGPVKPPA